MLCTGHSFCWLERICRYCSATSWAILIQVRVWPGPGWGLWPSHSYHYPWVIGINHHESLISSQHLSNSFAMSTTLLWRGMLGPLNWDPFSNTMEPFLRSPSAKKSDWNSPAINILSSGSVSPQGGEGYVFVCRRNFCEERPRLGNGNLFAFSFRLWRGIGMATLMFQLESNSFASASVNASRARFLMKFKLELKMWPGNGRCLHGAVLRTRLVMPTPDNSWRSLLLWG